MKNKIYEGLTTILKYNNNQIEEDIITFATFNYSVKGVNLLGHEAEPDCQRLFEKSINPKQYKNILYLTIFLTEEEVNCWKTTRGQYAHIAKALDVDTEIHYFTHDPIIRNKKVIDGVKITLYKEIEHQVNLKYQKYLKSIEETYYYDQMIKIELQKYRIIKNSKILEYKAKQEDKDLKVLIKELSEYFNKQDNILNNFQYVEKHLKDWVDKQESFIPYFDFDVCKEIDDYVNIINIENDFSVLLGES